MLKQIVMAGTGGQGLVSLATLLSESAMNEGLNTIQTQSYGVAQRGGFISAEVLISDEEILFQQVRKPDVVTVLHSVVGNRYDCVECPVIYDSTLVQKNIKNWIPVPCTEIAKQLGDIRTANTVAFGAMLAVIQELTVESMQTAIGCRFTKPTVCDLNTTAFQRGYGAAKEALGRSHE